MNAGPTWNNYAAQHHFATYPVTASTTFAQAYNGSDFDVDFDAILRLVAAELKTVKPSFNNDDLCNSSLENWPST